MSAPTPIPSDTKDWTWVLQRACPDCGFDAASHPLEELAGLLHDSAMTWADVLLLRPDVSRRPAPQVWSPLEYGCHVRDVHAVFADRVRSVLEEDEPRFAGWDQDDAAVEGRYDLQDPAEVAADLIEAAAAVAAAYASVPDRDRGRGGARSDGAAFTVETLGQYHLHDVVHHLWDVGGDASTAVTG